MALTTAQQVRLKIQDPWRFGEEDQFADGTASAFKMQQGAPYSTIISASASVYRAGWSATGGTWNTALGRVEFSSVLAGDARLHFNYLWAVFSDDEIGHFTAVGAGVNGAALEAVQTLMFDAWKRARWQTPDGTQYDDSRALDNLLKMQSALSAQVAEDVGPAGGFESWAVSQENYG